MSDACRHDWPKPMKTAVLFLIFNRLDTTKEVFEAIRRARPPRLYVASDGPRASRDGESNTVAAIRDYIMNHIDWDCQVKTLFRETNLGCKMAVSGAIDWFFENEEMGIILEDDCLPSDSFFGFCETLLEHYHDNPKVMMISGNNFQEGHRYGQASYFFCRIPFIWGWATWRRAWAMYDREMETFPAFIRSGQHLDLHDDIDVRNYLMAGFLNVYFKKADTWDYQWGYTLSKNRGVCICPQVNLVSNIGCGGGTHTSEKPCKSANVPRFETDAIVHPDIVAPTTQAEDFIYENLFYVRGNPEKPWLLRQFKLIKKRRKIARIIRRVAKDAT